MSEPSNSWWYIALVFGILLVLFPLVFLWEGLRAMFAEENLDD